MSLLSSSSELEKAISTCLDVALLDFSKKLQMDMFNVRITLFVYRFQLF